MIDMKTVENQRKDEGFTHFSSLETNQGCAKTRPLKVGRSITLESRESESLVESGTGSLGLGVWEC